MSRPRENAPRGRQFIAQASSFAELLAREAILTPIPDIWPVTKSKKDRSKPFPNQFLVDTYPPHPKGTARWGRLLRKLIRTDRRGYRLARPRPRLPDNRHATLYRGVEQPGSSSGS